MERFLEIKHWLRYYKSRLANELLARHRRCKADLRESEEDRVTKERTRERKRECVPERERKNKNIYRKIHFRIKH